MCAGASILETGEQRKGGDNMRKRLSAALLCLCLMLTLLPSAAYAAVADLEGDTPLAYAARLNHAQVLMHKGDFAAARDEFRALAAEAPAEAAAVMHQQVAEAAEAAGDKAGALAAYEAAVAALPPADQESAAFLRARIAELRK